ncbi:M56 family metallopeptidase [Gracilimonas sp. Q87]|uniref:M56 family metallopeptidase n=1 Tax=Gracilimonas sp. Q87 TaxID=3384766 RepID=UPI0039844E09
MIAYILNSILCLLALFLFYRVLLANEKCYRFNRFYLLAALVLGLSLPSLDFFMGSDQFIFRPGEEVAGLEAEKLTAIKKAPSVFVTGHLFPQNEVMTGTTAPVEESSEAPVQFLIFLGYSCVTFLLLLRFIYSIYSIYKRAKGMESVEIGTTRIRLAESYVAPHSFMDTIFVNKKDYKEGLISDEILKHEMAHIEDKHTLDILFVELVKVVFWFNPAVYLFSRAIKINHEFLADNRVLSETKDVTAYQDQLIKATEDHSKVNLASNLNFFLTKKRLLMMTKSSSLISSSIKIAALTPLIPILILLFNSRVIDRDHIQGIYETQLIPDTVAVDKNYSFVQFETVEGELFTGSNKLFDPKTGILKKEAIFENGRSISIKTYNGIGQVSFRSIFEYEEGIPERQRYYMLGQLFSEYTYPTPSRDYQGMQRYWYTEEGVMQYEAHFLMDPDNFHGLVTAFDTQGEITEQERYENGQLIEKIK